MSGISTTKVAATAAVAKPAERFRAAQQLAFVAVCLTATLGWFYLLCRAALTIGSAVF